MASGASPSGRLSPQAISAVWTLVDAANHSLTDTEPWKVAKDETQTGQGGRLATILVTAAEALRSLAVLLHPVIPQATERLWESLGAAEGLGALDAQPVNGAGTFGTLAAGTTITKGAVLFPRLDEPEV